MHQSTHKLKRIIQGFAGQKILVVGDLMLDRYLWGRVDRISPEAPVPVVEVMSESSRPGGAANVAANLAALDAEPVVFGVVGDDAAGEEIRNHLRSRGVDPTPEEFHAMMQRILATGKKVGTPVGLHVQTVDQVKQRIGEGWQFIALGSELRFMVSEAQRLTSALDLKPAGDLARY